MSRRYRVEPTRRGPASIIATAVVDEESGRRDGVHVRFDDGTERVLSSRQVLSSWEDYEQERDARKQHHARCEERTREAEHQASLVLVQLRRLGMVDAACFARGYQEPVIGIEVPAQAGAKLVALLKTIETQPDALDALLDD